MKKFTKSFEKILSAAAGYIELLPASGGALEEMTYTDETEKDDTKFSSENLNVDTFLESPTPNWMYRKLSPLHRKNNHLFRYFLDGSFRHYFLATGLEHDRSTPIFLAQTSLSILKRSSEGRLKRVVSQHQWVMLLSKARISSAAWDGILAEAQRENLNLKLCDLAEEDPISGKTFAGQDLREKGRGKTRYLMSQAEFAIIEEFRNQFQDGWLIKDGLLSRGHYGHGLSLPQVIAVAKSFTTTQKFTVRDGNKRVKHNISSLICNLPAGSRTPVFEGYGGSTGFWYLRLREAKQLQFPLFGVIKVEIPNISEQPITTELIDKISSALLAEQFVTPYGSDERWHSHLYPIYQAECSAKQLFYSSEIVQGSINNALRRASIE